MPPTAIDTHSRHDRFSRILTEHSRSLFGLIFAFVQSIADAEDVFQQTSITLWEKFDQFDPESDFGAWAGTIAKFKAIDFLRARHRDKLHFSGELFDQLAERKAEQAPQSAARYAALQICLEKLKPNDRQAVAACYEQGTNIKQAAEKLGRPLGSLYDSLTRIRRTLWSCMERALLNQGDN